MEPNFNDVNVRIMWCAAWNQAATIYGGIYSSGIVPEQSVEELAQGLFNGMYKPYLPKDNSKKYLQDLANGKVECKYNHTSVGHYTCEVCNKEVINYGKDPAPKGVPNNIYSDPSNDLVGDYPGSMNPPRKDKKTS